MGSRLYLLITGGIQLVFSLEDTVRILWLLQALIGTASAYFAHRIAWKLSDDMRVGIVAGSVLAISPVMLREAGSILTESFYIFFLLAGFWAYLEVASRGEEAKIWHFLLIGLLFGLATLTRATSLLFPVGLTGLFLSANIKTWRRASLLA